MRRIKIAYWALTVIIAGMMIFSASMYLTKPEMKLAFEHLGFPDYFRIELAIAKYLGAILLLAPTAARIKDWTYAGFAVVFISAFIAHVASGDPASAIISPVVFLGFLIASYFLFQRIQTQAITPIKA